MDYVATTVIESVEGLGAVKAGSEVKVLHEIETSESQPLLPEG
jgi:hypothetical protein